MPEYSEKELIKGCLSKNRVYQKYLYERHCDDFFRICVRYAKDFQEAEQILQDGFLKIFKKIKQFDNKGSFEGWMKRIVVNSCIDYLRSKKAKTDAQTLLLDEEEGLCEIECQAEAVRQMDAEEIVVLIQELPPMSRTVFNLFVVEGYSHREIAQKLEISEGTSQWHVNFARKSLQKKLGEQYKIQHLKVRHYG